VDVILHYFAIWKWNLSFGQQSIALLNSPESLTSTPTTMTYNKEKTCEEDVCLFDDFTALCAIPAMAATTTLTA